MQDFINLCRILYNRGGVIEVNQIEFTSRTIKQIAFLCPDKKLNKEIMNEVEYEVSRIILTVQLTTNCIVFNERFAVDYKNDLIEVEICAVKKDDFSYHAVVVNLEELN